MGGVRGGGVIRIEEGSSEKDSILKDLKSA